MVPKPKSVKWTSNGNKNQILDFSSLDILDFFPAQNVNLGQIIWPTLVTDIQIKK